MPEQIESGDVEDLSKKVDNPDAVVELIKKIQKIIKNKKNNILTLAYHQGVIFRKFKTNDRFISSVSECKISKTTINFKIDIVKFIDDYPQMRTSCISLFLSKKQFSIVFSFQTFLIILKLRKRAVLIYSKIRL